MLDGSFTMAREPVTEGRINVAPWCESKERYELTDAWAQVVEPGDT